MNLALYGTLFRTAARRRRGEPRDTDLLVASMPGPTTRCGLALQHGKSCSVKRLPAPAIAVPVDKRMAGKARYIPMLQDSSQKAAPTTMIEILARASNWRVSGCR